MDLQISHVLYAIAAIRAMLISIGVIVALISIRKEHGYNRYFLPVRLLLTDLYDIKDEILKFDPESGSDSDNPTSKNQIEISTADGRFDSIADLRQDSPHKELLPLWMVSPSRTLSVIIGGTAAGRKGAIWSYTKIYSEEASEGALQAVAAVSCILKRRRINPILYWGYTYFSPFVAIAGFDMVSGCVESVLTVPIWLSYSLWFVGTLLFLCLYQLFLWLFLQDDLDLRESKT